MTRAFAIAMVLAGCGKSPAKPASGEGEAAPFVAIARDALVGRRAPAATLALLDGTQVELATQLGRRPIYLKFWATWCVPCREQMPHLEETFRAHGDKLTVVAVDVGLDDPIENVRAFVAAKHLAVPVAFDADGSVAEQFHLSVTPQHVLIDSAGVVRFVGHAVTPDLERAIAAVLEPTTAASTASDVVQPRALPALALDDNTTFDLAAPRSAPIALTFGALFCDSYIADSRPEIGAACAAHVRAVEALHQRHPELTWITVAYPVWTSAEDIAGFRKRLGATGRIGIDHGNAWFRKFGVRNGFTTILVDPAGAELGRVEGDGAGLAAMIEKPR